MAAPQNLTEAVDVVVKFQEVINSNHVVKSKPKFKEHIRKLYDAGKLWIDGNKDLNTQFIMQLTTNLMSVVQTLQYKDKLKDADRGAYKKALVETVIKMLLKDHGVDVPVGMTIDNVMDFILQHLVPGVIETVIEVASGRVDIQKTVKRVTGCVGFCKDKKMCERVKKNQV